MSKNFNPRIHIGETHGIYTLVDVLDNKNKYNGYIYKGVCNECGYEKFAHYGAFSSTNHIATMCRHIGANGKYISPTQWDNQRIGKIFRGMKSRCYNQNDRDYKWYGGNGIKICDDWVNSPKSFEEWAIASGYSDNMTIDRIDENKNYCPENCRWISAENNTKYKSTTSLINVDGEIHTGKDWSKILKLGENRINTYIRKHGVENVAEFIRRYRNNPTLQPKSNQSYYNLYMINS